MIMAELSIVTFNLHGFNQVEDALLDLVDTLHPSFLFLQEHWLVSDNLFKLDYLQDYFVVASPAMRRAAELGPICGRPFGGLAVLINKSIVSDCEVVFTGERIIVIRLGKLLLCNVYMPCIGTPDRMVLLDEVLSDINFWLEKFSYCACCIGGDFNVNMLDRGRVTDSSLDLIKKFIDDNELAANFELFPITRSATFHNDATGSESLLDFFLVSKRVTLLSSFIFDPCNSFSDHSPVVCVFDFSLGDFSSVNEDHRVIPDGDVENVVHCLRWDKANLSLYYDSTRDSLSPVLDFVKDYDIGIRAKDVGEINSILEQVFTDISVILNNCAVNSVPIRARNAYKFWWDEEMRILKAESIAAHRNWVSAGKPKHGQIATERTVSRLRYRRKLREKRSTEKRTYSDSLHGSLINKDSIGFWRTWRSMYSSKKTNISVDNSCDNSVIVEIFANYLSSVQDPPVNQNEFVIEREFNCAYLAHFNTDSSSDVIDLASIVRVINELKPGKSPGPDNISVEHLRYSHETLSCILFYLFNWILLVKRVPDLFCHSFTVPIPKGGDNISCVVKSSDFRGIALSSVFSKTFENCLLLLFRDLLQTDDSQFGFKRGIGCTSAIFCARESIGQIVNGGNTACIAALDICKAFPRVNHKALLHKLLDRGAPIYFVDLLGDWLARSTTQVKWAGLLSHRFALRTGVNQGSVLAPLLFNICLNDAIISCRKLFCGIIILYADDVLLISRSRFNLQLMVSTFLDGIKCLNLELNTDKSVCLRIGNRHSVECSPILAGDAGLNWVSETRYLGVFLLSSNSFRCSLDHSKRAFNKACNGVCSKLLGVASEELLLHLISVKCLPILLYAAEVIPLNNAAINSLNFCVMRFAMRIFKSIDRNLINYSLACMGFELPSVLIAKRSANFLRKLGNTSNLLCKYFIA